MTGIDTAFEGRTGSEPVMATTKAGKPYFRVSVAVAVREADNPEWVNVAYFGDAADELAARCPKGTLVYVEGKLRLNEWTGKDGKQRASLSTASFRLHPLGQIGRRRPYTQPAYAQSKMDADEIAPKPDTESKVLAFPNDDTKPGDER
jgi:single-strand DNA-binding protein